jgi:predicted transglutaminase-like cysteine proteinase
MNPRLKSVAVSVLSICLCALSFDSFDRSRKSFHNASHDLAPMSDLATVHSPAVFFSINAVLLDTDRQRGRGHGAIRLAALTASNSLTNVPLPTLAGVGKEPFGLFTFRVPDGVLWHKWKGVEADVARDQVVLNRCRAGLETCPSHATRFLALIDAVASKSGRARLDEANRAVNSAILYVHDSVQHGEADRWSAPLLTLAAGKGDCEDYAIAKYIALQEAGFSRDDMRVVLVRDRAVGQEHAALAARIDDRWLILDNRSSELIEDLDASSLTPLFAINHRGVQIFAIPYASRMPPDTVTK